MSSVPPDYERDTEKTFPAFPTPESDDHPNEAGDWTAETGDRTDEASDRTAETVHKATVPRTPLLSDLGFGGRHEAPFDDERGVPVDPKKYRVIKKLGDGGMGTVWLVEHIKLGQKRAIKVIKADVADEPVLRARFEQEAKILAKLVHPNAVVVHDFVIFGDAAYIDMEYLEGETLRDLLKAGNPLPLSKVDWLLHELCEVFGQAHKLGIVHRDIKPENIMILTDGDTGRDRVKVLDFGIAKIIEEVGTDQATLSFHTEGPIGTYHYASPEQLGYEADSKKRRKVDHRSDIYSLGVMLYELLTGRRPFTGALTKLLYDHAHTPAPPFAVKAPKIQVHPAVEKIVLQCLNKLPADRPQSAQQLFQMFHAAVEESRPAHVDQMQTTEIDDVALAEARRRQKKKYGTRRNRKRTIVGVAAASCLAAGIMVPLLMDIPRRFWAAAPIVKTEVPGRKTDSEPKSRPVIDPLVVTYLQSKGYLPVEGAELKDGWPATIKRFSGERRPLSLRGRVYLPENDKPESESLGPNELPTVVVDVKNDTRFILIEGGNFRMGAWHDGGPFFDEEKPGHQVTLSSFYIQETEVSNGEIERFLKNEGLTRNDPRLQVYFVALDELAKDFDEDERKKRPAVGIPRVLAEEYAHRVGGELPSEAQWEFAARSRGRQQYYVWGDDDKGLFSQDRKANVSHESLTRAINTYAVRFAGGDRTDQGVLNMMGNVREWCRDVWHIYPKKSPPPDHVEGPADGEADLKYVIRGGSYSTALPADTARLTWRSDLQDGHVYRAKAADSFLDVGFRVVLEVVIREVVIREPVSTTAGPTR